METKSKALFFDRDGVINIDKGYVYQYADIVWFKEAMEMMKLAHERGYKVIVLTNQSGIYRGMYKIEDVELLHKQMDAYLKDQGCRVDDWIYCSEIDSEHRKPRPGMLLDAQKKHNIDLSASFMIGDKVSDVFETDGKFTRPKTIIIRGNYDLKNLTETPDVKIVNNHQEALKELIKHL